MVLLHHFGEETQSQHCQCKEQNCVHYPTSFQVGVLGATGAVTLQP